MFGIRILPAWKWIKDENGDALAFNTRDEADAKAKELGHTSYVIEIITE